MLVTDQTMPHLTGLALAKRIHKVIPGFPVLVCTGYSDEMLVRNEQADGVCQMLLKPVSRCVLAKAMREALRGRPAASNLLG